MSGYHFDGAGKYFRPMVVLLAAKACNLHGKLSSFGLVDMSAVSLLHAAVGYIACQIFGCRAPTVGEGGISVAFEHLSVCPSVAYIANISRTKRPSMPNFGVKVPHLRCNSHTSFKVKQS